MTSYQTLGLLVVVAAAPLSPPSAAVRVEAPLSCNKGPDSQRFEVMITAPPTVNPGATISVRIDGLGSGEISQVGLDHLHHASSDYLIPVGSTYVEGSARLVPDTGTANVRAGALVAHRRGVVTLTLPGHVANHSSYTPPSIEFKALVTAVAGETLSVGFSQFRIVANAFLIGDVKVVCDPKPKPFSLATVKVIAKVGAGQP